MFAKVFSQIFDSSIAERYTTRHVFMDLLVLADTNGSIDMTVSAVSRRTNVPEEIVSNAIKELMEPDSTSRSREEDGRRLVALDSHRDWGWQVVNYEHYRDLQSNEARREYFRDYKRAYRAAHKGQYQSVSDDTAIVHRSTDAEGEGDTEEIVLLRADTVRSIPVLAKHLDTTEFDTFWNRYPRKIVKLKAKVAWSKHKPPLALCLKALEWQCKSLWSEEQFIPYPSTWINQHRWEDDEPSASKPKETNIGWADSNKQKMLTPEEEEQQSIERIKRMIK